MAYRDSFAVAVLVNGKVQREDDKNTVTLPFSTEYSLRIKNKHRRRAVADVHIDGRLAAKGIVINGDSHTDLERFVGDNLKEGARFKIVKRTDSRVEQPDDNECGNIEVRMYLEREKPALGLAPYFINHICNNPWMHCSICCSNACCESCHPHWHHKPHFDTTPIQVQYTSGYNSNVSMDSVQLGNSVSGGGTVSGMGMNLVTSAITKSIGEDAATVAGSVSNQTFVPVLVDVDTSEPVTLRILLRGIVKQIDKCACGNKRRTFDKHCSQCGEQLVFK
jgi:hypothetical protein